MTLKWRHRIRRRTQLLILIAMILFFVSSGLFELSYTFFFVKSKNFHVRQYDDERQDHKPQEHQHVVVQETCRLPRLDPENKLSKRFDQNVSLVCPIDEVRFTQLNAATGNLSLDLKALEKLNINCSYSFFRRKVGNDNRLVYSGHHAFPDSGSILMSASENLVNVSCFDGIGDKVYYNTHMYIPKFRARMRSSASKPSFLIIFLDSLSQLAFKRMMKQTKKQLDSMGFQYLNYFLTVKEGSFFNIMTFLTGKVLGPYLEKKSKEFYYDTQFKYLWKQFKDQNYTTGLMEDMATTGLFHASAKGFKKQPTDFYPHAFWNQIIPLKSRDPYHKTELRDFCYGMNGYKVKIFLDQVLYFILRNRQNPYFLIASYSQMTRENRNLFRVVDNFFANFFKTLSRLIKNTIVVLAGDHGPSKGPGVATSIGRLEERMSLFAILISKEVSQKYPHLKKNIAANANRLVSWLDVNIMAKEFADGSFRSMRQRKTMGMNPATHVIAKKRTCDDAGIQDEYCVCGDRVYLDLRNGEVASINKTVNRLLERACNRTVDVRFKYAHYDLQTTKTVLEEQVTVCFTVGDKRKRIHMNLTRDWKQDLHPSFRISGGTAIDSSLCL